MTSLNLLIGGIVISDSLGLYLSECSIFKVYRGSMTGIIVFGYSAIFITNNLLEKGNVASKIKLLER
ncbi:MULTISPECIES: hypothetical protein [unclassified Mesotoga]|uniref:hypothetical protein n=1 Tax=unclassified Mesotoga TaxID=1184398 RepID=UPI000DA66CB2|nr:MULTISPECIES: hypothetical protein [unclassified Mesotoga]PZC51418.1 hypothetical protein LH53_11195 [Mesotoga sp. TolDC]PZC53179.1 hypothetical protein LH53_00415 [Mesotoga sp. TolDC]